MQYTHLGRTGLTVSRFCLGTMNFGSQADEAQSWAIMDRALEHGINFFDTADVYSTRLGEGHSEQIIGRWLAQKPGRREQIVLATKVYQKMGEGPNDRGLSAYHIRRACEDSLRRLQTDHIDLYQMHHVDRTTPWEEIWQVLEQLVREGKVLYVGSSNFAGWHIARANEKAAARNFLGLVSEQSRYSLRDRTIELEVIPACREYGLGIIPWSPLAGGLLAGSAGQASEGRRSGDWMQRDTEKYRTQLEAYRAFCEELGEQPADVALAWVLHNPVVTGPIIGPRTLEQLGGTPLAVAQNGVALGVIYLKDTIKPGIRERFEDLRRIGIRTIMITGDNPLTAATIARESGVDDFVAQAKPEDKIRIIKEQQAEGRLVAMTGDGTNDAPALAQADVAVAMNSGTAAAKEAGNMVDLDSDPTKLLDIVQIGKQLLMTRGALTTFSIANDVAKYFAIIPAVFVTTFPELRALNIMDLNAGTAILSAVIFNALIIVALIPLALRGIAYRAAPAADLLRRNLLIYGIGGIIAPFIGIKIIDVILNLFGLGI